MENLETKLNLFQRATLKLSSVLLALTLSYSACSDDNCVDGYCVSSTTGYYTQSD